MSFERIDDARDEKGGLDILIEELYEHISNNRNDINSRLKLESKLNRYLSSKTPDWILNFLISFYDFSTRETEKTRESNL